MKSFKKMGLALGGGGGKGAYHIGLFKALQQNNLVEKVTAIAGSSVGCLNAALFVQGDFNLATYIWLCEIEKEILYFDEKQFISSFSTLKNLLTIEDPHKTWNALIKESKKNAIFSRKGLLRLIDDYLTLDYSKNNHINIYATCTRVDALHQADYFNLPTLSTREAIINVLLASSAIPAVFGHEEINGKFYLDGGVADNLPIKPLYDEGCDLIITAPLWKTDRVKTELYPHCHFIELVPETDLGGIAGVFNFSSKNSRLLMRQAYDEHIDLISTIPFVFNIGKQNEASKYQ